MATSKVRGWILGARERLIQPGSGGHHVTPFVGQHIFDQHSDQSLVLDEEDFDPGQGFSGLSQK